MSEVIWEELPGSDKYGRMARVKVPGGWLVKYEIKITAGVAVSMTFYPDPEHVWQDAAG